MDLTTNQSSVEQLGVCKIYMAIFKGTIPAANKDELDAVMEDIISLLEKDHLPAEHPC